ncbi:hypothetical protein [Puniceibacterium confluentis]|uniref:hypothetical protein n=1 Tax=Puniceibacterium confluentis TaxID=1958944 RepID=UPI0011B3725F|nr:hypothetical protein [Puniceibacterium confluentis]
MSHEATDDKANPRTGLNNRVAPSALSGALVSIPLALILTVATVVQLDLSLFWAIPLYCLFGATLFAIYLLPGYMRSRRDR